MKKRLLSMLLIICLLLSTVPFTAAAADEAESSTSASGVCGDNVTWTLEDGTLTISGSGDMYDYGNVNLPDLPFYDYRDEIITLVVEDGITRIGDAAFYDCFNIETVTLGSDITSIGSAAFEYCSSIVRVNLPDGLETIEDYAFCWCYNLARVRIPASVTSIADCAFFLCDTLLNGCVYYIGSTEQWNALQDSIGSDNECLTDSLIMICGDSYYGVEETEAESEDEALWELLQQKANAWFAAYSDYTDAVKAALYEAADDEADDKDDRETTVQEMAEEMLAADEAGGSGGYYYISGISGLDDDLKEAAYQAYSEFLYDYISGCEDIDLGGISATDANAAKIVNKIADSILGASETYTYGKISVSVSMLAFGTVSMGSLTVKESGIQQATGMICSSEGQVLNAVETYLEELQDLEASALYQIVVGLETDILGQSLEKLTSDYLAEKLSSTVLSKLPDNIGDLLNDLTDCYDYWNLAKTMYSLSGDESTAELQLVYTGMQQLKFTDSTISKRAVKKAWKALREAAEDLTEAYGEYCAGTLTVTEEGTFSNPFAALYKAIFSCPVNVTVYDASGTAIGYAGDDDMWYTDGLCYIEEAEDAKTVYILTDEEVTYELTATAYGLVGCSFETYDSGCNPVGRTNYYDIEVEEGQTLIATADSSGSCSVVTDGVELTATEYLASSDYGAAEIAVEIEGSGEVTGDGTYVRGDAVVLTATPASGWVFVAWYDGEDIVSTDRAYEFTAKEDTELTALFLSKSDRDIVLVLDVSTSMKSNSKLTNTKTAAKAFVSQILESSDNIRIAIVTYGTSAKIVCDLTDDEDTLLDAIDSIRSSGNTNLYAGLTKAGSILAESAAAKKAIVVMSDGEANTGTTSSARTQITEEADEISLTKYGAAIYDLAEEYREDYDYTIYSLGFGLDEGSTAYELMKHIASFDSVGNRYFWSVTSDNVDDLVFTYTEIADTASTTEKTILIVIECPVEASVTLEEETLDNDTTRTSFGKATVTEVDDGYEYSILLEDSSDYDILITGIDSGTMDFAIYYYEDDEIESYRAFEEVPITATTTVTTSPTDREEDFTLYVTTDEGDAYSWTADVDETVVITDVCTHEWDDGEITVEPDCETEGEILYTCTICGSTYTEELDALGHTWDEGEVLTEATKDEDGEILYTCTVCGKTSVETIPAGEETDEPEEEDPDGEEETDPDEEEPEEEEEEEEAETVTLTYDANYGRGKTETEEYEAGETITVSRSLFSRTGYRFVSWNTEDDGSGDRYKAGDELTLEEDITLYAQWRVVVLEDDEDEDEDDEEDDDEDDEEEDDDEEEEQILGTLSPGLNTGITGTTGTAGNSGAAAAPSVNFSDVAAGAYYADAVAWAAAQGITSGTTETTFGPDESVTRAQLVTFLYRLAGSPSVSGMSTPFTDISGTDCAAYYDAIVWAYNTGVTTGTTDTSFSPHTAVTRGEVVTFLYRYYGKPAAEGLIRDFTDVSASDYYAAAVQWAAAQGIASGTTDTTFSPDAPCTRADCVTFLYRAEN